MLNSNVQYEDIVGRVEAREDDRWQPCGTGFYVLPDLVITAWHVIAGDDLTSDPAKQAFRLVTRKGPVDLRLAYDRAGQGLYDAQSDWVALSTPRRTSQAVFQVGRAGSFQSLWQAFGYPAERGGEGLLISGHIEGIVSDEQGGRVLQLYSHQLAGSEPKMQGFSGSPCIQDDRVVAIVRSVDSYLADRAALATIFATPFPQRLRAQIGNDEADEASPTEPNGEARQALEALLKNVFTIDELRGFVETGPRGREVRDALPSESSGVPAGQLRTTIVDTLVREGLVNSEFWERIAQRRPLRRNEIRATQRKWQHGA